MTRYVTVRFTEAQAREAMANLYEYAESLEQDLDEPGRARLTERAADAVKAALNATGPLTEQSEV